MNGRKSLSFLLCLLSLILFIGDTVLAQEEYWKREVIGEAFGKPVTSKEFMYYYATASLFTRTGAKERTEDEIRIEAWQNLIYRRGARELGITVAPEKVKEELERLLLEKDIVYGTTNYYNWIRSQFNEDPNTFERRMEDLLIIAKLAKAKGDPEVTVTEEEMKQKFLNQYSSFESEYIRFETKDEAGEFRKKVEKNPRLWKETYDEKKEDGQKGASWINIMSLEALIDLWKIPKDDAYNILSHKLGDFIVAEYYYGIAVFRLLRKKDPDLEKYDEKKQEYYRDTITKSKKHKLSKAYFDDLLSRANYRDYVEEEKQAAKVEGLKKKSIVVLETNRGKIKIRLFPEVAPFACENFIGLVEKGYYNGIIFHRVIKDFMIQGGDPTGTGRGGDSIWEMPFVDEVSDDVLFDKPGLLAMANSGANTNKSQFFITTKETPHLNKRHTIFGEVISGLDVVKKIESAPADSKDKPKEEQKIVKAYIGRQAELKKGAKVGKE
jgi:peptidylprolyl isomerase